MPESTEYLVPYFSYQPSLNDLSAWTSLRVLSALFTVQRGRKTYKTINIILSKDCKAIHALCREAPKEHLSLEVFVLNKNSNSIIPYLRVEKGILKLVH